MDEIRPGVWHWQTRHEKHGIWIHSYYLDLGEVAVVVDPRVPSAGLDALARRREPAHAYLTNRHHYRHADAFVERYGCTAWCHGDGLHEFGEGAAVRPFEHGTTLPGEVEAIEVGVICPEETALLVPKLGVLCLGDAVIRVDDRLAFVPDELLGDDPEAVKAGLREVLGRIAERCDFTGLLLAHGEPWAEGGRERLRGFVEA